MTNNKQQQHARERQLSVRGARRAKPDTRRLARVLIEFATAEAEAEAARQAAAARHPSSKPARRRSRKDAA